MSKYTGRQLCRIFFIIGILVFAGCSKDEPEVPGKSDQNTTAPASDNNMGNSDSPAADTKDLASASEESGVNWLTDYEQAKAKAQKEGKDLVLNFSGSDWCIFCIQLEKNVFSQEEFAKEAEKYFVFMLVDFPDDQSDQPAQVQRQNQRLAQMYGFQWAFPTIYLARADGQPYAIAQYQQVGPKEYLDYLLKIRSYKDR